MSQAGSETQMREPAIRVFASELLDATHEFKTSDSEMAPNYTLLPTGERANRVLVYGSLTTTAERESSAGQYMQARVSDGEEIFYLTASQYQPDARTTLQDLEPPAFVGIVGKLNHYQNSEGEDRIEIRPERITEVPETDRDEWVMETAIATMERIQDYVEAPEGSEDVEMAKEQYDVDLEDYIDHAEAVVDTVFRDEEE